MCKMTNDDTNNNANNTDLESSSNGGSPTNGVRATATRVADQQHQHQQHQQQQKDDVLRELYWYVTRSYGMDCSRHGRSTVPNLRIGDVITCLQDNQGIFFWRDERFYESQNVALQLAGQKRSPYTQSITAYARDEAMAVHLDYSTFCRFVSPCASLFLKAFSEELVIPDWKTFVTDMTYLFYEVEHKATQGMTAQYIPILRDANPDRWALSICSIDGQRVSIGEDALDPHTLQSVCKPVNYALGLAREGHEFMEQWIDVEPAGRPFNTQDLDPETQRPFNASINSGAIMAAGILSSGFPPETKWREIVDDVRKTWFKLCGNDLEIGFSQETFESEKSTAFNNFAIAYNLKGRKGLPRDVDLHKMLDVYLGCCSIEITTEALSVAAATLANGGVCPITGKEVFPADVVRTVLAETMTCGMYNQSGHFAVQVGLPAKSGVSGALMVMVPNVMGFATFSPRLNEKGNSVRGIEFCRRLVNSYRVHIFEPLRSGNTGAKIDPRRNGWKEERRQISRMAWAVQVGDVQALRLRDIFLFALCQTAMASPEGLSERMLQMIRDSYEQVYQASVDESLFADIQAAVKKHPKDLHFLKELVQSVQIKDSFRTLVVMAMFDIIMMDKAADAEVNKMAIQIAVLLGVDEDVALMELNRYKQDIVHRFEEQVYCNMIEYTDMAQNHHRRTGSRGGFAGSMSNSSIKSPRRGISKKTMASLREELLTKKDDDDDEDEDYANINQSDPDLLSQQEEEIVALRKEVLYLRRKLGNLSHILNDRTPAPLDID